MEDTDKTRAQLIEELNALRRQLEGQNRRLSLEAAVERVRAEAATMRQSADIAKVILAFTVGLEEVGVRHETVCVNIVDEEAGIMHSYNLSAWVPREMIPDEVLVQENAVEGMHLLRGDIPLDLARQRGWSVPGYEIPLFVAPDTFPDDLRRMWHLDIPEWDKMVGRHGINVPFTYGGLYACARQGEVYSEADLELVRPFANAMDLGYARYFDFQELEAKNTRLEELDAAKTDFLSGVAHELRTPMTAIRGYIDNLLDGIAGQVAEGQANYLSRIRSNADRLTRMVNDLLDLSRIDRGRTDLIDINIGKLPIDDVVKATLEDLRPLADEKDLKLTVEADEAHGMADRDRLTQVVTNLVGNAIKFTETGEVQVTVRSDGQGNVRTAVRDTGRGIPADSLERVFERLYQVREEGATRQGSGLGLAISKEFVELMGGKIWAESEVGKGSTFTFTVPEA